MHSLPALKSRRLLPALVTFLFISAIYLFAFPQANVFYAGVVLLHVVAGVFGTVLTIPILWNAFRRLGVELLGWIFFAAGGGVGFFLVYTGTPRAHWNSLYLHIVLCVISVGI